jgi:hypothetical protein
VKTQDGQTQDARLEPRALDQVKVLVRGWAEEARQYAAVLTELRLWDARRKEILAGCADAPADLLLLENVLADRVKLLLAAEEKRRAGNSVVQTTTTTSEGDEQGKDDDV